MSKASKAKVVARSFGWVEEGGQIGRRILNVRPDEPNYEYANSWEEAVEITADRFVTKLARDAVLRKAGL